MKPESFAFYLTVERDSFMPKVTCSIISGMIKLIVGHFC